jgi:hypothetical protein
VGWKLNKASHSSSSFTLSPNVDECSTVEKVGALKNPESSEGGPALSVSSAPCVTFCILCGGSSGWGCIDHAKNEIYDQKYKSDGRTHNHLVERPSPQS